MNSGIDILNLNWNDYSSFHQNEAWARGLNPLLAKLVDTSVTWKAPYQQSETGFQRGKTVNDWRHSRSLWSDRVCLPPGHVMAILETIKKLGLDKIISEKSSRIRNLVVAMIGARIINPQEKKRNQDNFPVHSFRTLLEDLEIMTIANPLL